MTALVIAEHDNNSIKAATLNTVTAAKALGGDVHVLVAGANAGGAAADDGDIHLAVRPEVRRILEEQIQHFLMETTRLMRIIEEDAVLFHARRVEVVRRTSQRHDQRVVRQLTLGHQQLALLVMQLGEGDRFGFTVNIHHRSQLELEVVVTGVSKVAQRVYTFIK